MAQFIVTSFNGNKHYAVLHGSIPKEPRLGSVIFSITLPEDEVALSLKILSRLYADQILKGQEPIKV